jgi:hypothetical protein
MACRLLAIRVNAFHQRSAPGAAMAKKKNSLVNNINKRKKARHASWLAKEEG